MPTLQVNGQSSWKDNKRSWWLYYILPFWRTSIWEFGWSRGI